jgi:hypothetical protein
MRSPTPVMHQLKHGRVRGRVAKDFAISKGSALIVVFRITEMFV